MARKDLGEMAVFVRWVYRDPCYPWTALLVSAPMNRMAAEKAYGPMLVGPADDKEVSDGEGNG